MTKERFVEDPLTKGRKPSLFTPLNDECYVGSTHNLQKRIREHNEGTDITTKKHLPVKLVYFEEYESQEEAWKCEKQIHGWSRVKKEELISGEWIKQP